MSEVTYSLKTPFEYSSKGEQIQASFISLTAPSYKQLENAAPIKSAFMQAVLNIADSDVGDTEVSGEKPEIDSNQVMQVLYSSPDVNMPSVLVSAAALFKSGVALVDGQEKMTQPLIDKMQLDDFEGLVGAYIANFIMPSLMDGR